MTNAGLLVLLPGCGSHVYCWRMLKDRGITIDVYCSCPHRSQPGGCHIDHKTFVCDQFVVESVVSVAGEEKRVIKSGLQGVFL